MASQTQTRFYGAGRGCRADLQVSTLTLALGPTSQDVQSRKPRPQLPRHSPAAPRPAQGHSPHTRTPRTAAFPTDCGLCSAYSCAYILLGDQAGGSGLHLPGVAALCCESPEPRDGAHARPFACPWPQNWFRMGTGASRGCWGAGPPRPLIPTRARGRSPGHHPAPTKADPNQELR